MVIKEECGLCGRVLPYYRLRRCARCGRLYCKDCMVEDVTLPLPAGQRLVCLKCAKRAVSPRRSAGKYGSLTSYLVRLSAYTDRVTLSFSRVEGVLGGSLPESAFKKAEWWKNTETTSQGHAWLLAGWQVKAVDLERRLVTFERVNPVERGRRRKRKTARLKKPFTPVPVKRKKPIRVSKTKISRFVARMKNVQRRRAETRPLGKLKPKSAHEKRLYKPEAKPKETDAP